MSVIEFPDKPRPPKPPEDEKAKLERLRHRAKTDLMWLATEVLGYDFQENPHRGLFNCYLVKDQDNCRCGHRLDAHGFHGACPGDDEHACECLKPEKKNLTELDPKIKRRLILWPRGHFKTSAMAVEAVQLILNFPDIRIMILAGDLKESRVRLEEIKGHFENWGKDGKLKKLFPEFCSPVQGRRLGNSRKFVSPARKTKNLRQGTLEVFSPKVLKTGTHFDVALIDDLVNELNSKKPEGLLKAIDDYKAVIPVIDPEGYIYVSGTRYDYSDCYGYIQEIIATDKLNNWMVSTRVARKMRCQVKGCDHSNIQHMDGKGRCAAPDCKCAKFDPCGDWDILFPRVRTEAGKTIGFTAEVLDNILKEIGARDFGCQYENNPLSQDEIRFSRELLMSKVRHHSKVPTRGTVVFQIDIATGQEKRHDDMVIMVSRIKNGRHHLIDCVGGHFLEDQQPVIICNLIQKYAPRAIFIEKKTGAGYLQVLIKLEAQRRGLRMLPTIELMKADNTDGAKEMRIGAILGYLTQDRVLFKHGMPHLEKLFDQLQLFPRAQLHDDYADCLGALLQAPTGFENDPLPEDPVPYWMREPQKQQEAPEHTGLPFGLIGFAA